MVYCPVSVCIPTYNYAGFLPQTIESILRQSFKEFELLIIDDCSTDDTAAIVSDYASRDRRIRFCVNKQRLGMVDNWNACLAEVRGRYIKFVFADDLLLAKDALWRMMVAIALSRRISLVCCARRIIDSSSLDLRIETPFDRDLVTGGLELITLCLTRQHNLIGEPTAVMFKKADAARGFLREFRQIVDQEMWFHILEMGDCAFIREPLVAFRKHPGQQSVQNRREPLAVLADVFRLNEKYLSKAYVRLNRSQKMFIEWDCLYRLWRLHTSRQIPRKSAVDAIDRRYGFWKFFCCYPLYKIRAMTPMENSL